MPHTEPLPGPVLEVIAKEVALRLPRLLGDRLLPSTVVAITSSFEVWGLSAQRLSKGATNDLDALAAPTGRWHHQISLDGKPGVYARSVPAAQAEEWTVQEVGLSSNAERLDAAIDWVDATVPGNDLARLLEAPAYHLLAIWLVGDRGEGRVLVVTASRRLADLVARQLIPESTLLSTLGTVAPVVGIDWRDEVLGSGR